MGCFICLRWIGGGAYQIYVYESGRGEGEDLPMVEEYREGACIIKVYDDAIRQPEEQEAIRKRVSKIAVKEEMGKYRQTQKED